MSRIYFLHFQNMAHRCHIVLYCFFTLLLFFGSDGRVGDVCSSSVNDCCGGVIIDTTVQICCEDIVRFKTCGDPHCCASHVYNRDVQMCCNDFIASRSAAEEQCCGIYVMDSHRDICCGGNVSALPAYPRPACCGPYVYDMDTEACCEEIVQNIEETCYSGSPTEITPTGFEPTTSAATAATTSRPTSPPDTTFVSKTKSSSKTQDETTESFFSDAKSNPEVTTTRSPSPTALSDEEDPPFYSMPSTSWHWLIPLIFGAASLMVLVGTAAWYCLFHLNPPMSSKIKPLNNPSPSSQGDTKKEVDNSDRKHKERGKHDNKRQERLAFRKCYSLVD